MTTVYGWTFRQWASAAAIMNRSPKTIDEALDLMREWHCKWPVEPTEKSLIHGVEKPMDHEAAKNVFMAAIT